MATYSSNTTIKVNTAISATATNGSIFPFTTIVTAYTAPANSYAIVQWHLSYDDATCEVLVGGKKIFTGGQFNGQFPYTDDDAGSSFDRLMPTTTYIGPGQSIQLKKTSGPGSVVINVVGVSFINTP